MRPFATAATALALVLPGVSLRAQDLEPRAYTNSPVGLNFAIVGYGFAKGSVLVDPSLPLDNLRIESNICVVAYATTLNVLGKSAKFDVIVPYVTLAANGLVFGEPRSRYVTGFADPLFRFTINFIGAPALTVAQFKDYKQDFIFGASLRVTAPLGQYDSSKIVNVGTNRWSIRPELGFSKAFGPWTVEFAPAVCFFTDNGNFFGGQTRQVAPIYAAQFGVTYTVVPGGWVALNAGYYRGAQTTIDGVVKRDQQEGMRFGVTLALPLNRHYSVKLYGVTGYGGNRVHDFQAAGLALQYRWGGGF